MNSLEFSVDTPRFDGAKCAEVEDKDLFFPDNRKQEAERLPQLKAICASCINVKECLEYALEKQILYGIWGGLSPAERGVLLMNNGKTYQFTGIALAAVQLIKKGFSANEIALQVGTSLGYVQRVARKLDATEQGAAPLHKQTKNLSEGLR